ncbi:MAG: hypothetical protein ACLQDL_12680 [Spirochaetia bacterium]
MRLTINGEEVSYSLEHEKTLGEVVHGIRAWLAAAGFVITGLRADDRDILESPDGSWGGTGVDTVTSLGVTATHTGDMKLAHWRTVDRWLAMLEEETTRQQADTPTEPGSPDPLEVLLEGLPQTVEGFAANPFLPPGSDAGARFQAAFAGQAAPLIRAWTPEVRGEAVRRIQALRGLLQARIDGATHPRESLSRCAGMLRGSMTELREVSLLLQTGRDKPAMDIVIRFTDTVQSLMDVLPFLAPDPERARLLTELTPVLRELVAAFGSRDSVLIGDLLEYEVAPRIEKIAPLLESAGAKR